MLTLSSLVSQIRSKSEKILISSVFCSALVLAFISGTFYARDQERSSRLVINVPDYTKAVSQPQKGEILPEKNPGEPISITQESNVGSEKVGSKECSYIGSKNSDKYHLASCGVVKRIKPENVRCFGNPEMAEAAGYKPGCLK